MALAIIYTRAVRGINAPLVVVEAHLSQGIVGLSMVGLPETAVKESKDRVRSAIINSQFEFPIKRITINLAPADLPKEGGRFDLPIALGILAASQQIPQNRLEEYEFCGELALSGELRPVRGILPLVLHARNAKRKLIVPLENAEEAALIRDAEVFSAKHLLEVCAHLQNKTSLPLCSRGVELQNDLAWLDLADVRGQTHAKRALQIAAAGKHSLLFIGPPGTGKTMLATRLTSILPPLSEEEALEVAALSSISSRGFNPKTWRNIPFRFPHHTSSSIALVGGGRPPQPGEISLAHHGVLFLDELPEYSRHLLECLREPLESAAITISRAAFQTTFPAKFQLIAAMNPCACGYAGSSLEICCCTPEQIKRYIAKISGPLLDRIDMQVEVPRVTAKLLSEMSTQNETSMLIREKVIRARNRQLKRQNKANAELSVAELDEFLNMEVKAERLLQQVLEKFNASARAYHRIKKLAFSIADFENQDQITTTHLSEAFGFRCLDRKRVG